MQYVRKARDMGLVGATSTEGRRGRMVVFLALIWMLPVATFAADAEPVPQEVESHCISEVKPEHEIDSNVAGQELDVPCFNRFADAIHAATGGLLWLGRDASPKDLSEEDLVEASLGGVTIIGINYEHSGFRGSTFTWFVNNTVGCRTGFSYFVERMPGGWNDEISSSRALGGCEAFYHYETSFFGGAARRCIEQGFCEHPRCSCYHLRTMSDETSSLRWFRSGFHY